jgi:hypothetical protein
MFLFIIQSADLAVSKAKVQASSEVMSQFRKGSDGTLHHHYDFVEVQLLTESKKRQNTKDSQQSVSWENQNHKYSDYSRNR